jgi:hypothetical protein
MKLHMHRISPLVLLLLIEVAVPSPNGMLQAQPYLAEAPPARRIPAAAKVLLEKAEDFELLSLEPIQPKEKPKDNFHGWKVLGKTTVKEAANRKRLAEAFKNGNTEFKWPGGDTGPDKERPKTNFSPRHALRVTHDGKTADFVISFASYEAQVTVNGGETQTIYVTRSPADVFDEVLKEAGVPLASPPDYTAIRIEKLEQTVQRLQRELRSRPVPRNNLLAPMLIALGAVGFGWLALDGLRKLRKELESFKEENKTAFAGDDGLQGFEFKIVRNEVNLFEQPQLRAQALSEEARAGWQLVEKIDGNRLRLKRPASERANDSTLPPDYDPYRTAVLVQANNAVKAAKRVKDLKIAGGVMAGCVAAAIVLGMAAAAQTPGPWGGIFGLTAIFAGIGAASSGIILIARFFGYDPK